MLLSTNTRIPGNRFPTVLRMVAPLVLAMMCWAPLPVHADALTGSLWIPGVALNIGQPVYGPSVAYPTYPGYAPAPYTYSRKSYRRAEKYQRRLVKRERKADHRYWKAIHKSEKRDRKAERRYAHFLYRNP
ncbi:hypothetical protein HHS34_011615 [Acidithiobacillus montserratensis]|uniref:Uncharacterized protein n=1 Tax=Acidithiobacillus montserratensis TaxID=2729135 RepID=A0ACD5HDK5_9PROT|nr:hypothetical protein [Acidithiobacillus montserratensis]